MQRWSMGIIGLVLAVWPVAASAGFRYVQMTNRAAQGDKYKVIAATYFGTEGHEEFVGAQSQGDGTVVAFGNTWGPTFPATPEPEILGKGEWYEVSPWPGVDKIDETDPGKSPPDSYPNRCGFMAFYSKDLGKLNRVVKFDWSVATISVGMIDRDDGIIIAGRSSDHFRKLAQSAEVVKTVPVPEVEGKYARRVGPHYFEGIRMPGDTYVAKLSPDGKKLQWVWIFEGHRAEPDKIWVDHRKNVLLDIRGLKRISADGGKMEQLDYRSHGRVKFLTVSPHDGSVLCGGDVNSGTGREPWRKPIFKCFESDGTQRWEIYGWGSKLVGHDEYRLVSDSAIKHATHDDDGHMLVVGWSDGGNSVLTRNPVDLDEGVANTGMGFSIWNAGVLSVSYVMRIRSDNFQSLGWTRWVGYLYQDGQQDKPNSVGVKDLLVLGDNSLAMHGGAASGLIQTPNAFVKLDKYSSVGYGGPYVTVFSEDFKTMLFSSYVPGCRVNGLGRAKAGVLVASQSTSEDRRGTPSPVPDGALPTDFAAGYSDGHLMLLGPGEQKEANP